MENDFRRAVQLLQIARQCRPRSPDDAVPILHQCLLILDRLVAFIPRAHRMQLEAFAELAANHRALVHLYKVAIYRFGIMLSARETGKRL